LPRLVDIAEELVRRLRVDWKNEIMHEQKNTGKRERGKRGKRTKKKEGKERKERKDEKREGRENLLSETTLYSSHRRSILRYVL